MVGEIIQIATAAVPFLMKLFGGGKTKEQIALEKMPEEFLEAMRKDLKRSDLSYEEAEGYWKAYISQIQTMSEQGYGSPQEIMARGSDVWQDTGQAQISAEETERLQRIADSGPNAKTTLADVDAILDQMGIGAGATFDAAEGIIRDSYGRVIGNINDVEKKILDLTGATFKDATAVHDLLYGQLRTRMGEGFKEQRGQLAGFKTDAEAAINKAFSPDATSARVGRAFAPAQAATAFRARRGGLNTMDPTYNAMLSRVEASRSRAVDDALSLDAEKLAMGKLGIYNTVLGTGLGISRDEMGKDIDLSTADEAIKRGLILDKGAIDRQTLDTAAQRRIAEEVRNSNLNLANTYRYQDKANEVYAGRIAARADFLANSRADLAVQAGLSDRRISDRDAGNRVRAQQYNYGMGFTTADLARKDRGTTMIGQAANDTYDRSFRSQQAAGGWGNMAYRGYTDTLNRQNANSSGFSGMLSNLVGSVGRAASDYFKGRGTSGGGAGTYNPPGWNPGTGTWDTP